MEWSGGARRTPRDSGPRCGPRVAGGGPGGPGGRGLEADARCALRPNAMSTWPPRGPHLSPRATHAAGPYRPELPASLQGDSAHCLHCAPDEPISARHSSVRRPISIQDFPYWPVFGKSPCCCCSPAGLVLISAPLCPAAPPAAPPSPSCRAPRGREVRPKRH